MSNIAKTLINTDADMPLQAAVYALINDYKELVIEFRLDDDRHRSNSFCKQAVVDRDETIDMARHLNIKVEELPNKVYEVCGVSYDSTVSHAESVFQKALEFILDCGARFNLNERRI